ncbi:MAG: hypothetical protein LCH86_10715 [Proteobacteria bacterium]|nr:hypothetical protein [Pseudomonadota bacterium]
MRALSKPIVNLVLPFVNSDTPRHVGVIAEILSPSNVLTIWPSAKPHRFARNVKLSADFETKKPGCAGATGFHFDGSSDPPIPNLPSGDHFALATSDSNGL